MNHILEKLQTLVIFDLENGPFLTGGFATWLVESRYTVPSWTPNDIDICCTTVEQFDSVKQALEPLSTYTQVTNWLNSSSTYWTINDFQFQAFVHPVTVNERLSWVDFTVTAIATDGINFLMQDDTLDDIKNKVLRYNDKIDEYPRPLQSMVERYYKYLSRGYTDPDNQTLNKLTQLHEIWSTI
jgi:hypothetical protein